MGDVGDQSADLILLFPHIPFRKGTGREISLQPAFQRGEPAFVEGLFAKGSVYCIGEHTVQPLDDADGAPTVNGDDEQCNKGGETENDVGIHDFTAQV